MTLVLGVDGCAGGWCCVPIRIREHDADVLPSTVVGYFSEVLALPADIICVDIPIGLLDAPRQRECDVAARRLLGLGRASSVFPPPSRGALAASTYREACDINEQLTGKRLSKQAFNIGSKTADADAAVTPRMQKRVYEVHPELCFAALKGTPAASRKNRLAGRTERWDILRCYLPTLPDMPLRSAELPPKCAPDDYIDALVCAWTAVCVARRTARPIPAEPEVDERGLRMEMWLPG